MGNIARDHCDVIFSFLLLSRVLVNCRINSGEEMTSNFSKSSDRYGFYYVSICVAFFSVFIEFLLFVCDLQVIIFLRNVSFSITLLCTAKDYWKFRVFSTGPIKFCLNNVQILTRISSVRLRCLLSSLHERRWRSAFLYKVFF